MKLKCELDDIIYTLSSVTSHRRFMFLLYLLHTSVTVVNEVHTVTCLLPPSL